MNSNWIITIYDWSVNFLMNIATALGTTYEALNVWVFVIIIPAAMGISILMNLYFISKSVRHECVLRENNS
jgi:hypothetical protein